MPEFRYVARNQAGLEQTGTLSAASRHEAVAMLTGQSMFPLKVEDATPTVEFQRVRRVPAPLLAATYSQLADLLKSGVPLLRSLNVIQKQTSHAGLKAIMGEITSAGGRRQHAGRRHDALPTGVGRNGGQHDPRRRRRRIPRRSPQPRGPIYRDPGRSEETHDGGRRLPGLPGGRRHHHRDRADRVFRAEVQRAVLSPPREREICRQ